MSQSVVDNLCLDLEELQHLANIAERTRVKQILAHEIKKIEGDLQHEKILLISKQGQSASGSTQLSSNPKDCKRYQVELKEYAWDQSDKFIKIFVTINDVQQVPEENINVGFTENSFNLLISNLNNKDYTFVVNHLLHEIDVLKSYRKVKSDMVAIYLAKANPAKWTHLTVTAKRLQDLKNEKLSKDNKDTEADPTAGLMKIMQQLYENGDPETKRMINKAWHESQSKQNELKGAAYVE